jgi:hypothetical protein
MVWFMFGNEICRPCGLPLLLFGVWRHIFHVPRQIFLEYSFLEHMLVRAHRWIHDGVLRTPGRTAAARGIGSERSRRRLGRLLLLQRL